MYRNRVQSEFEIIFTSKQDRVVSKRKHYSLPITHNVMNSEKKQNADKIDLTSLLGHRLVKLVVCSNYSFQSLIQPHNNTSQLNVCFC